MKSLSCILLLVERGAGPYRGLGKALLLARHFGAQLELLLCETRWPATGNMSAPEVSRAKYIAEGERYLQALRQTIVSPGVEIGAEVMCAPSVGSGLTEKLRHTHVQMIVKAGHAGPDLIGPLDWHLFQQCAVPLLLTAGRPWRATPRFAAVLDLSERTDGAVGGLIVDLSEALARRCSAELDYLYAAPIRGAAGHTASEAHRRLCALLPERHTNLGRLQYCSGDPAVVLPRLVVQRDYDLLAMGAVSGPSFGARGKLAAALLQASAGDALLVPAGSSAAYQESKAIAG